VTSRCQRVQFTALTPEAIEAELGGLAPKGQVEPGGLAPKGQVSDLSRLGSDPSVARASTRAAARLAQGDLERARFLLSEPGAELRAAVEGWAGAIVTGELGGAPWSEVLALAEARGEEAAADVERRVAERGAAAGGAAAKRAARDAQAAGRRAGRRRRTEVLDLSLALLGAWFRDLSAVAEGAGDLILNADRRERLDDAAKPDPRRPRRASELVLDARRRLRVNVSEDLALESLSFRAEYLLGPDAG